MVTPGEFLAGYAERSGTTPAALLEAGRVVVPCTCDFEGCRGWKLVPADCLAAGETGAVL